MNAISSGAPKSDERECPFCAETVKHRAILCKHCGKDLPQMESAVLPPTSDDIDTLIRSARPIKENRDSPESLCGATWRGDWAVVKDLISKGGDPKLPNETGDTALDLACARGDREIVRLFLTHTVAVSNSVSIDAPQNQVQITSDSATSVMKSNEKQCIYCAKVINDLDAICPFCQRHLPQSFGMQMQQIVRVIKSFAIVVVLGFVAYQGISALGRDSAERRKAAENAPTTHSLEEARSNLLSYVLATKEKNETLGDYSCSGVADDGWVNCKATIFDEYAGMTGMRTFLYRCRDTRTSQISSTCNLGQAKEGAVSKVAKSLPLPMIVAKLADRGEHTAQIDFELGVTDQKASDAVTPYIPVILNFANNQVSKRTSQELSTKEGKKALTDDILRDISSLFAVSTTSAKSPVDSVRILSFVLQ